MIGPTLLHLVGLAVVVGLPGWLLYRAWLRRLGLSWRVGAGIVLAGLSVLFSDLAALAGYRLWLMLVVCGVVLVGALVVYFLAPRRSDPSTPPTTTDVLFHLLLFAIFLAPAFVLYLPLDTDAQGFGYLALMVRQGGTIDTLAPWQPEVRYLYSPALFVWWAFFSDLFHLPLHQVMLPFTHVAAGLAALLSIDLGAVLLPGRPRMRWLLPLTLVGGLGLFLTLLDSAYTSILALLFVILFLILTFRAAQEPRGSIVALASVALAAVALTHPDTIIILLIGYLPFYLTFWLSRSQFRTRRVWLRLFVLIPAIGVVLTLPWVARVLPLFFEQHVVSPFVLRLSHIRQLILYHGLLVPLAALAGVVIALRRRRLADLLIVTWLIMVVDFSMFGLVDRVFSLFGLDVMRYVYPFSVAWHGPIIPYAYLAALALDSLLDWRLAQRAKPVDPLARTPRWPVPVLSAGLGLIVVLVALQGPILEASAGVLSFFGAFSSRADLAAMAYLREHTPEDALVLNYPLGFEGHWVPVIAERKSVTFREQPFFSGAEPYYERAAALSGVYFDLAAEDSYALVQQYGVTYVIVPQIVGDPARFGDMRAMMRWRWPEDTWRGFDTLPSEVDWLELLFEQDGAQVYRVLPAE
jgi:hypothetical protein